jgi:hypothetical protein
MATLPQTCRLPTDSDIISIFLAFLGVAPIPTWTVTDPMVAAFEYSVTLSQRNSAPISCIPHGFALHEVYRSVFITGSVVRVIDLVNDPE